MPARRSDGIAPVRPTEATDPVLHLFALLLIPRGTEFARSNCPTPLGLVVPFATAAAVKGGGMRWWSSRAWGG